MCSLTSLVTLFLFSFSLFAELGCSFSPHCIWTHHGCFAGCSWICSPTNTHTHTRAHRRTSGGKCKSPSSCFTVTFHQSGSFPFFCNPRFISKYYEALSESPHRGTGLWKNLEEPAKVTYLVSETFTGLCESDRTQLLCTSGGLVMTSKRKLARLNLRRSLSEQLRSSTSKAWDLLWKNVKERRLAGQ